MALDLCERFIRSFETSTGDWLTSTSFVRLHQDNHFELASVFLLPPLHLKSVSDSQYQLSGPPSELMQVLRFLKTELSKTSSPNHPTSITLPPNLTQVVAVPLAALLLEYPIAYVPASADQTSFLSLVSLDVYEGVLEFTHPSPHHTLVKFSCPSALGDDHPERFVPSYIMNQLRTWAEIRLQQVTGVSFSFHILHNTVTLDRVGL